MDSNSLVKERKLNKNRALVAASVIMNRPYTEEELNKAGKTWFNQWRAMSEEEKQKAFERYYTR